MSDLVLAVDIGNSQIKLGLGEIDASEWLVTSRLQTARSFTQEMWGGQIAALLPADQRARISVVICASVVPAVNASILGALAELTGRHPRLVSWEMPMPVRVTTDQPWLTGTDRIVNANAAWLLHGGPSIVIDAGTATKIDAITERGEFPGGIIAPGIRAMMDALASRAAQLSSVPLELPPSPIGRNTTTAVQAGVLLGHTRMIQGLVEDVQRELGGSAGVIMTGGFSALLSPHIPCVRTLQPTLTLDGLRLLVR